MSLPPLDRSQPVAFLPGERKRADAVSEVLLREPRGQLFRVESEGFGPSG